MTPRFFSGRESWLFRARAPEELCGHHADLIGQLLAPDEHVEYLLYSPLREASGAPFGVRNGSGSHAVAVTRDRIIISRDSHRLRQSPTVCQIPFANILVVELGEALTLGWLVVRFVAQDRVADESIFFQSSGIDHFRAAVRAWRRNVAPTTAPDPPAETWRQIWTHTPSYLRSQLAPVLVEDDGPHGALQVGEIWSSVAGRRRPVCLSGAGLFIVTNHDVLLAQSERPHRPGALVFAVNVSCFDRRIIRDVIILRRASQPDPVMDLVLDIKVGSLRHQVTMSLGCPAAADLDALLAELRRAATLSC